MLKAYSRWLLLIVLLLAVAIFTRAQGPLYELPSANAPLSTGSTFDLSTNGRLIVASNMLNGTISLVDIAQRTLLGEVVVGDDPRGVSLNPDNNQVLVVNRGDGTLSVIDIETRAVVATYPVGVLPYAVVTTDDRVAYVSVQGTHEVIAIDYTTGEIINRIPTPDDPFGLALWGDFLYVTHLWSGEFSLIYLPQQEVVRTIVTGADASLAPSAFIDRTSGVAYVPRSASNTQNTALTYDSTVLPVLDVIDLQTMEVIDDRQVLVNLADRPVNMPFAATVDSIRNWVFVVNAGTDDISVIDQDTGVAVANIDVGGNPRAAILTIDNTFLYVHNTLEGSLTIVNTRTFNVDDVLPISDLRVPIDLLLGAELFHAADDPRIGARSLSCASCHFDGLSDRRVWQHEIDAVRNTPLLYDLLNTAPYTWTGGWDELTDVELKIREWQFGTGLLEGEPNMPLGDPHGGLSPDLDILAAYVASLASPPSPHQADAEQLAVGQAVFEAQDCASCHGGETFTDGMAYDVGTGGIFDTPTLRWLWLSAPYLHDGQAETLRDVFILPGDHQLAATISPEELDALIAYLNSLPRE